MAQNVIDWVWKHSRAVNASLIVLLAIAHEANRDGEAEMSALELASKCRLGERSVYRAVRELAGAGELDARDGGGRGRRTRYRVATGNPANLAPFEDGNPANLAPFEETLPDRHPLPEPGNPANLAPFTGDNGSSGHPPDGNPAKLAGLGISDKVFTSTGSEEVQVKPKSEITRADVEHLCDHLADRIAANGSKRPEIGKRWRDAARLMIDSDGHTEEQILAAIDWCQDSEFWRANILSMPKLREKYDQLRLRAQSARVNTRSTTNDRARQGIEAGRRVQEMLNQNGGTA